MYENITGIILSGGKSFRMGTNKSFLKIGDDTVIGRLVKLMNSIFANVILITNEPDLYSYLNVEIHGDIYKSKGPLAGIHSGLTYSKTESNFIVSCDIPLLNADIIKFIANYQSDKPIVVPRADGFVQQLCGIYSKNCITEIEQTLIESNEDENRNESQNKRKCRVLALVDKMQGTIIDIEKEYPSYKPNTFLNLNRPEDYEQLINLLKLPD